jgi:hypothetical protein
MKVDIDVMVPEIINQLKPLKPATELFCSAATPMARPMKTATSICFC